MLAAAISLLLVVGIWLNSQSAKSRDSTLQTTVIPSTGDSNWRPWLKASKVRVSAVAFYGRRRYVRILDKYLKQNLISAGGLLEEVSPFFVLTCITPGLMIVNSGLPKSKRSHEAILFCIQVLWIVRTDDPDDLDWLEQTLLPSEPKCYKSMQSSGAYTAYLLLSSSDRLGPCLAGEVCCLWCQPCALNWVCLCHAGKGFANHYRQLASDTHYIKLDDDIVYIKEGAVEAMLYEKLRSRFWIVSANVINHSGGYCIPRPTLNVWHRIPSIMYLLQSSLFGSQVDTVVSLFCKQHHTSAQ